MKKIKESRKCDKFILVLTLFIKIRILILELEISQNSYEKVKMLKLKTKLWEKNKFKKKGGETILRGQK